MRGRSSHRTPGYPSATRTDPGERTCPLRPDRIRQNVRAALLEQHRGMVDQRDPQLIAVHARRRFRWLDVRNETGGWLRPAGELPSQDIEKAARLRGVGIEEALPVKVPRKRRCAGAILHELYLLTVSVWAGRRSTSDLIGHQLRLDVTRSSARFNRSQRYWINSAVDVDRRG